MSTDNGLPSGGPPQPPHGRPQPPAGQPQSPYGQPQPPYGPPHPPAGPPHPPGGHQPRWAWWVVGIVIPVVGIIVTLLVGRPGSSDDDNGATNAGSASNAAQRSGATGSTGEDRSTASAGAAGSAADPLFGPKVVEADTTNAGSYLEFDTTPPLVSPPGTKGADLIISASTGTPDLFVPDSNTTLAPLPASGADPTAEECAESVDRNATYTSPAERGGRFCLLTDQGRVVHLKILTAPPAGLARLEVTVWDAV
ncbi:hypothetical protein [Streptomyces sp. T028]|uniref:hypothetical protein n=1 Tax=Streptomyces sp. T028 TaxID=3394379 RepID=UPI003A8A8E0B